MSGSATSSLENCHLICSVDGTVNLAYHSSPSDSDRSASQERGGGMDLMRKRTSRKSSRSPEVCFARESAGAKEQETCSDSRVESAGNTGTNMDLVSTDTVTEDGDSFPYRQSRKDLTNECEIESSSLTLIIPQNTSKPIGAKLVVTSPALSQQNSVRVPAPLPFTCTSVASNNNTGFYSDSELIPRRNSLPHTITKMVATEHRVTKQQPELPKVFPPSSGKHPSSLKRKPMTNEVRRQNRAVVHKQLHQWHSQRSLSAGNTPGSRQPVPDGSSTRGSRPRARTRQLNHSVSSSADMPVHGSADVAGVLIPNSLLPSTSSVPATSPNTAANHSSIISISDSTAVPENSFGAEIPSIQKSASRESGLENMPLNDDGVFEEESGSWQQGSSAVVADDLQAENPDPPAEMSNITSAENHTGAGVPNRAILRRGSGE